MLHKRTGSVAWVLTGVWRKSRTNVNCSSCILASSSILAYQQPGLWTLIGGVVGCGYGDGI